MPYLRPEAKPDSDNLKPSPSQAHHLRLVGEKEEKKPRGRERETRCVWSSPSGASGRRLQVRLDVAGLTAAGQSGWRAEIWSEMKRERDRREGRERDIGRRGSIFGSALRR